MMGDNTIDITVNAIDNATSVLGSIAEGIGISFGTKLMDVVGNAFSFVGDQLNTFVANAGEAQDVQTLFNAVLDNSPLAGYKKELLDLADAYSKTTRFEDENIISAETVLARYQNLGQDIMPQVLKVTLDMATLMKTDATSAAQTLGKALEDISGGSLSLLGRTKLLTKEQKDQAEAMAKAGDAAGAQAYVLDILDKKTAGLAEAMGTTYKGKMEIFKNTLQNLQETLGGPLLDALGNIVTKFTEIASDPKLQQMLLSLTTLIAEGLTSAWQRILPFIDTFLLTLNNGGSIIDAFMAAMRALDIGQILTDIAGAIGNFVQSIDWGKITTDLLNGLKESIKGINFMELALTLAIDFQKWVKGIKWDEISQSLITGIQSIDWNTLGTDLGNLWRTLWDTWVILIQDIVTKTDWGGIFSAIGTALMDFSTGLMGGSFAQFRTDWSEAWNQIILALDPSTPVNKSKFDKIVKDWADAFDQIKITINRFVDFTEKIDWIKTIASWAAKTRIYLSDLAATFINWTLEKGAIIIGKFGDFGINVMIGLLNGIEDGAKKVLDRIAQIAADIAAAFADALDMHSPSQVFARHGANIMAGLTEGIQGGLNIPVRAMVGVSTALVSSSVPAMQGAAGNFAGTRANAAQGSGNNNMDLLAIMKQIADNTNPDKQARMMRDMMLQGAR
jgi:hypothetical protein